jgi:hypothetical protein
VHPVILALYESKKLQGYLEELSEMEKCSAMDLACEEKILLKILEKEATSIKM